MDNRILAATPETANQIAEAYNSFFTESQTEVNEARRLARPSDPTITGDTAIIPIRGVLTYDYDFFTWMLGGTAYSHLLYGIAKAEENSEVKRIIFDINSPGGFFDGVIAVSDAISQTKKETIAYVSGSAASAAYWLASSADEIVASRGSFVGSIGVYAAMVDDTKRQEKEGVKQWIIVSSNAPYKVPDVSTKEGREEIQRNVNKVEDMFINDIANNRGVDPDTVRQTYGQGRTLLADEALSAGMVDRIQAFNDLFRTENTTMEGLMDFKEMTLEQLSAERPDLVKTLREEGLNAGLSAGAEAERNRLSALNELIGLECADEIVKNAIADGTTTAETASIAILKAQRDQKKVVLQDMQADAQELEAVRTDSAAEGNDEDLRAKNDAEKLVKLMGIEKKEGK